MAPRRPRNASSISRRRACRAATPRPSPPCCRTRSTTRQRHPHVMFCSGGTGSWVKCRPSAARRCWARSTPIPTVAVEQRPTAKRSRLRIGRAMIATRSSRKEHAVSTPNNYAPPQSVVADISSSDVPFEKATRLSRFLAVLLDALIFGVPLLPLYSQVFGVMIRARGNPQLFASSWQAAMSGSHVLMLLGSLVNLALLVITAVLVYRNAQTIGKKLMGIKVARKDGSRASLARIFWLR